MRKRLAWVAASAVGFASLMVPGSVQAVQQVSHGVIVSDNPVPYTPNIIDPPHDNWHVESVAKVGNRIIVAGKFTQVQNNAGGTIYPVTGLFAFDATTGLIDVNGFGFPVIQGRLDGAAAAEDGTSVYISGNFAKVDGVVNRKLAKLDVATGNLITQFKTPGIDGKVNDVVARAGKVYIAGAFTAVKDTPRGGLAAFDPVTGALDTEFDLPATETRRSDHLVHVDAIDVTPDGSRMLVAGNFNRIGGVSRKQIGQIDLTTSPDSVASWVTNRYDANCAFPKFDTYIRDVDYSPDGQYFAVATTGATAINFGGSHLTGPLCDSVARFETNRDGLQNATWADFSGGDTNYSVAVTDTAVYVGGHQRWQNNYFGRDSVKAGGVEREGIAAMSPLNGVPFSWNPSRVRGLGAQALLATGEGLWVGSDTDRIGTEYHAKIALMPANIGLPVPAANTGVLPGDLYTVEQDGDLIGRGYDPSTDSFGSGFETTADDWSKVRGAFMLSGRLYYGWDNDPAGNGDNATFRRQDVDLTSGTVGTQITTDMKGLDIDVFGNRHPQMPHMGIQLEDTTGMFWDQSTGRMYYTVSGDTRLYYRYFNPESNLLGDFRFTACTWSATPASNTCGGMNPSTVRGMTMANGEIFFGASNGNLSVTGFDSVAGRPAVGASVISGPGIDGNDWNSRGLFVRAN